MGIGVWIILAAVVLLLVLAVGIYNRLVRLRALAKESFSGITVQLRRRADLVPNLVETVQGYATHEPSPLAEDHARRRGARAARRGPRPPRRRDPRDDRPGHRPGRRPVHRATRPADGDRRSLS